jgi:hypothetical protein
MKQSGPVHWQRPPCLLKGTLSGTEEVRVGKLPFTERHPPVIDTDGAITEASHDERAMGVAGQTCHAAVSACGDVLGQTESSEEQVCSRPAVLAVDTSISLPAALAFALQGLRSLGPRQGKPHRVLSPPRSA